MESYYQRHKDKWKAYYESHKAEISIRNKIQREKNRPARLADLRKRSQEIKMKVLTYYGGYYGEGGLACKVCGENRLPCLSIDHIKGGGTQHMNCQMVKKETDNECHRDEKFEEGEDE